MNPIDDLFRDGLGGRKPEVSSDLWAKIKANKAPLPPKGEEIDYFFKDKLADRVGQVPAGMWKRIAAARGRRFLPWKMAFRAAAAILVLFLGYLALTNLPQAANSDTYAEATPTTSIAEPATNPKTELPSKAATDFGPEVGFKPGEEATTIKAADFTAKATTPLPSALDLQNNSRAKRPASPAAASAVREQNPAVEETVRPTTRPFREEIFLPTAVNSLAIQQLPTPALLPEPKRHYRPKAAKGGTFRVAPRHRARTELLFGVSYANQSFQVNAADATSLLNAREVSEFPEAGYQITLRQTHRFTERFHFMGGLTYAEIRNQFDYPLIGSGRDLKINNQIRMLEAPLLFGYSLPGKRLKVSLNAGPVVNLTTATRGIFLHPDFPTPLDLAEEGNYRRNVGMGFMTSLTTTYPIGNKEPFILVLEPFFKSYFSSFTQAGAPLAEKYWVAGIQLGVRKGF